jgi:hypothetical protein
VVQSYVDNQSFEMCCANWSARDLRSADNHARARSCVFKAFFQFSFIKTLDKAIYYYFNYFEIFIIYIILYYNYKSDLYFRNLLKFCFFIIQILFIKYFIFIKSNFLFFYFNFSIFNNIFNYSNNIY